MPHCYACGLDFHPLGWPKHVAKEKRLHGADIFIKLKCEREGKEYPVMLRHPIVKRVNATIYDFMRHNDTP